MSPILRSSPLRETPGALGSTSTSVCPARAPPSPGLRASTVTSPASPPLVTKHFEPSSRSLPSTSLSVVRTDEMSEPAFGSVAANATMVCPAAIPGRCCCCCSSVPRWSSACSARPECNPTQVPSEPLCAASSVTTRVAAASDSPAPPKRSGTVRPNQPRAATASSSSGPRRPSRSMRSLSTCSAQKLRTSESIAGMSSRSSGASSARRGASAAAFPIAVVNGSVAIVSSGSR